MTDVLKPELQQMLRQELGQSAAQSTAARQRFLDAAKVAKQNAPKAIEDRAKGPRIVSRKTVPWAATVGLAAAAAVWLWVQASDQLPTFVVVEGASFRDGHYAQWMDADEEGQVRFENGAQVGFGRGSRLRVRGVDGIPHFELTDGNVEASLRANAEGPWVIEAGPFRILSVSSASSVSWNDRDKTFEISVRHGEVRVVGPKTPGRTLRTGEHLRVCLVSDCEAQTGLLQAARGEVPLAEPRTGTGAELPGAQSRLPIARRSPEGANVSEAAASSVASSVANCEADQVARVSQFGTAQDVAAMTARCLTSHQDELVTTLLRAQRIRFGGSTEAAQAAFLLGRMDARTRPESARAYFESYLREAPNGEFRREALGRLLILSTDDAEREALARTYLSQYPEGPYARLSESILR